MGQNPRQSSQAPEAPPAKSSASISFLSLLPFPLSPAHLPELPGERPHSRVPQGSRDGGLEKGSGNKAKQPLSPFPAFPARCHLHRRVIEGWHTPRF